MRDGKPPVWMPAYGPKALALAGQKAGASSSSSPNPFLTEWMVKAVRQAARDAGRDPDVLTICVAMLWGRVRSANTNRRGARWPTSAA